MNGSIEPGWTFYTPYGVDDASVKIKQVLRNAIDIFLTDKNPFGGV